MRVGDMSMRRGRRCGKKSVGDEGDGDEQLLEGRVGGSGESATVQDWEARKDEASEASEPDGARAEEAWEAPSL